MIRSADDRAPERSGVFLCPQVTIPSTAEHMIRDGYELDPIEVQYALDWLKVKSPEEAVGFEVAVKGGRKLMSRSEAGSLGGRGNKADSETTSFIGRGSDYILARLERDRPDILEEFRQGGGLWACSAAIGRP